jgi:hypothetical protein
MKKFTLFAAGLAVAAAALPATANAQGWQNINARQANIEARINQGVRSGALTRREAVQLRAEFRQIARLEYRYRMSRPGLTRAERRDLDRRFDILSRKVRFQKNDWQARPGRR